LEGVVIKYKEKKLLKNIIHRNQLGKQEEPMARVARELRQSHYTLQIGPRMRVYYCIRVRSMF